MAAADRAPVVTGIGMVGPGGTDRESFWLNLRKGVSSTRRTTLCDPTPFRSQSAGEVRFSPSSKGFTDHEAQTLDRAAQLLVVAADEAVTESGAIDGGTASERVGVYIGSAVGATTSMEKIYRRASHDGALDEVDELLDMSLYDYFVPSSFVAEIAKRYQARGSGELISNGCTSGIDAVGRAAEAILSGEVEVAIVGATEAPVAPITFACFDAIMATSDINESPESASRPYDESRAGFVLAEGAAVLVMESRLHAEQRHAHIYGAVSGYGARSNAYHMTGLRADGVELAHAISSALASARADPSKLDYVNAHGSGTKQNDLHETAALKLALGAHAYGVPVSSIKSMIGHSMGAIGAIEVAVCFLAIRDNFIPPTANLSTTDPELDLDYVPNVGRERDVKKVLSIASGFGGFQSAIVVEEVDHAQR